MANYEEEIIESKRGRGIYLLPNLLTTGGLFAGFYAVVAAMKGIFDIAAMAIFIAMIADTLDGRVARLTNTQSAFGAQYDSLSDMVAFGVAPSLVVYHWSLTHLGKLGWLAAFCFTVAGALRLARFNAQIDVQDKRYFQGVPIPAAAGIIAGMVWVGQEYQLVINNTIGILSALVTIVVALLMVSNIPYSSFKELDFKEHVPFITILIGVLAYIFISIDPPSVLFACFTVYGLSGPFLLLIKRKKTKAKSKHRRQIDKNIASLDEE